MQQNAGDVLPAESKRRSLSRRAALPGGWRCLHALCVLQAVLGATAFIGAIVFANRAALFGLCVLVFTHVLTGVLVFSSAFGFELYVTAMRGNVDQRLRVARRLARACRYWFGLLVLAVLAGIAAALLFVQLILILVGTWPDASAPDASAVAILVDEMRHAESGIVIGAIVYSAAVLLLHAVETVLFAMAYRRYSRAAVEHGVDTNYAATTDYDQDDDDDDPDVDYPDDYIDDYDPDDYIYL